MSGSVSFTWAFQHPCFCLLTFIRFVVVVVAVDAVAGGFSPEIRVCVKAGACSGDSIPIKGQQIPCCKASLISGASPPFQGRGVAGSDSLPSPGGDLASGGCR